MAPVFGLSNLGRRLVESVVVQDVVVPAWVTVTTFPAMVTVPVRGLVDGLAATV